MPSLSLVCLAGNMEPVEPPSCFSWGGQLPSPAKHHRLPQFPDSDSGPASGSGGSSWPLAPHPALKTVSARPSYPWTAPEPGVSVCDTPTAGRGPLSLGGGHGPK